MAFTNLKQNFSLISKHFICGKHFNDVLMFHGNMSDKTELVRRLKLATVGTQSLPCAIDELWSDVLLLQLDNEMTQC